jgi:hypothetical protein
MRDVDVALGGRVDGRPGVVVVDRERPEHFAVPAREGGEVLDQDRLRREGGQLVGEPVDVLLAGLAVHSSSRLAGQGDRADPRVCRGDQRHRADEAGPGGPRGQSGDRDIAGHGARRHDKRRGGDKALPGHVELRAGVDRVPEVVGQRESGGTGRARRLVGGDSEDPLAERLEDPHRDLSGDDDDLDGHAGDRAEQPVGERVDDVPVGGLGEQPVTSILA